MEEQKCTENIKVSTVMAGRLDQRHSVCYRGMLQLGSHREHAATDAIASNPQTPKAKHQLHLANSPHTGFWGWFFDAHFVHSDNHSTNYIPDICVDLCRGVPVYLNIQQYVKKRSPRVWQRQGFNDKDRMHDHSE